MGTPGDWPVEGLLVHIAGQGEHGFRVVDVWESEDAFHRFGNRLMPVLEEAGVKEGEEIYSPHTFVSAVRHLRSNAPSTPGATGPAAPVCDRAATARFAT